MSPGILSHLQHSVRRTDTSTVWLRLAHDRHGALSLVGAGSNEYGARYSFFLSRIMYANHPGSLTRRRMDQVGT